MTIPSGTRLGPYEIVAPIGAGGMGEVFQAKDTRLDRSVAIKVLPAHLSSDARFRERFDREARAVSALNHPNICTLHDVGHHEGIDYIVMELLEGETLADRLTKGPLPLEQVLRFGAQIADGLDKAHRQGIVHRDLKPGNVMITKSGVKLLDFGLAKTLAAVSVVSGLTNQATEQKPLTQEGTILGTFQYMAPEQLEGEEADPRTDIFALGAVLYEMATGHRAFEGKTKTSLIASIVGGQPRPIREFQPLTPTTLEHVIRKCLSKDRDDRWQSAHDIGEELRWIGESGSQEGVGSPAVSRRKRRDALLLATALAASVAAIALGVLLWRERTAVPRSVHSAIVAPAGAPFEYSRIDSAALSVSPDGRFVTFAAADSEGRHMLWLRRLDSDQAQPLIGTDDAICPFWSPDSRAIGFFSFGKLRRMDIGGGPAVALADAADARGGTWSRDGIILFTPQWRTPIYSVPAAGGAAKPVTRIDERAGETTHRWPTFLPDGRHFLYLAGSHRVATSSELNAIYAGSIDSNERKLVVRARSNAIYVRGFILFMRENWLLAQAFDPRSRVFQGQPLRVAENVTYDSGFFRAAFGASDEGKLAYLTGSPTQNWQLAWYDRTGNELSKIGSLLGTLQTDVVQSIRLSPDDARLALEMGDTSDIWIFDLARDTRTRFTTDPMNDFAPVWSPDGKRIIYSSDRDVLPDIYQKATSGLSRESLLLKIPGRVLSPTGYSSDGRFLALDSRDPANPDQKSDVWVLPLTGDGKATPVIDSEFREENGQFSPDGSWLTYQSNENGRMELYAISFPSREEKRQLTNTGVGRYFWRNDGQEILFMTPDRTMNSIAVNGDSFDPPRLLFKSSVPMIAGDVSRDGTRIIVAVGQSKENVPITLVTNWQSGLQRE